MDIPRADFTSRFMRRLLSKIFRNLGRPATLLLALAVCGCVRARPAGPGIQEVLYRDGLRAFHLGTPEGYRRAATAFQRAWRIEPENCDYSLNLAQSLVFLSDEKRLNLEEHETSRSEAIAAADGNPCPGYESFRIRLSALLEHPADSAVETIERAIRLDPLDAMNRVVYWKLLAGADEGSDLRIEDPEELDRGSALFQYESGELHRRRGDADRAAESYRRALELNPSHYRSYVGLGHMAFENESSSAEPLYGAAVRLAPDFLEGRLALGNYYSAIDEVEPALAQYRAALETNPDFHPAHFSQGVLLLDIARPDDAEPHFREVVRLDPSNADAYYYLGNIQYGRGRFGWAQIQYELALAWDPSHMNAEYGFGKAAQESGDLDEALRRYEHVVEMAPGFPDGYFSRASVRSLREEYLDALSDYATTTSVGEQQVIQTESRIRLAAARASVFARAERRRLEEYAAHIEEIIGYATQNRAAVETYLRQIEAFEREQRRAPGPR